MNSETINTLAFALIYLWIGFVCAISFMEAWLKFRAPGVTLSLGLGIGRLVFRALNKMEWVFAILITATMLFYEKNFFSVGSIAFVIPLIVLLFQTFWLLPVLDARAEVHIKGDSVPPSKVHFYYVIAEVLKVISLFIYSIK